MLDYFRNKKIRRIFRRFPSIDRVEQSWLLNDLIVREERLCSDLHLHKAMKSTLIAERIVLIDEAINILRTDAYKDNLEECLTVKKVYAGILK